MFNVEQIEFTSRKLIEFNFSKEEIDKEEISWLEDFSYFLHMDSYEYLLLIPDYKNKDILIKKMYPQIPTRIKQILLSAIEVRKNLSDTGFLLIVYLTDIKK